MPANWVVEHFNVVKDILAIQVSGAVDFAFDTFTFKQLEKTFSNCIVVAIS